MGVPLRTTSTNRVRGVNASRVDDPRPMARKVRSALRSA